MFTPKADETANQALKVQRLVVGEADSNMYTTQSGSTYVLIREPVDSVILAQVKDDSANTMTQVAQASISICDSAALTAGGDRGAICIAGLSLDTSDCAIVEYTVQQS